MALLEWHEDFDAHDNTVYTAAGLYEEGFEWRIKPVLVGDRIRYDIGGSDDELIGTGRHRPAETVFDTLAVAQAACQQINDRDAAEIAAEHADVPPPRPFDPFAGTVV